MKNPNSTVRPNGLPPADSDDDPDPAGDDAHAHGFEEHEEEVGIVKDSRMSSVSASAF